MKKVLLIMAAALMTMTQCRKQETVPATPSADTIKMTITAGPGAKTDITDEGRITWTSGDVLYVSDGAKWLGSLTLNEEDAGSASGTFTGNVTIGAGTNYHFFYLGKGIVTTAPTANTTTDVSISFASQDGSREGALKYHLGHGSADVTVREGEATGAVRMSTKIAIAHINFTVDSKPYTGAVKMTGVRSTMTVKPDGTFSGSGDGITIGNNSRAGDRYVTLIPTGPGSVNVGFAGTGGSLTFGQGIQSNNLYGMATPIPVELSGAVLVESVSLDKTSLSLLVDGTATLEATVSPAGALDKSVTWSSSDETKATVDQNGVVTAVAAGEATITVTTVDGNKTATCTVTVTKPSYLPDDFTVSSGKTVKFSKGNLWYDGSAFKFETNQWDTNPTAVNQNGSSGTYSSTHVSHFLWSPDKSLAVGILTTVSGGDSDVFFTNATQTTASSSFQVDGEEAGTWRTLSKDEWVYLMNTRTTNVSGITSNARYAEVKVNGVCGMMLFPDVFTWPSEVTSIPSTFNISSLNWNGVDYTTADFGKLESAGVVFLPAAGRRYGKDVDGVGSHGCYWSSSPADSDDAYSLLFTSRNVGPQISSNRPYGRSVRLVR